MITLGISKRPGNNTMANRERRGKMSKKWTLVEFNKVKVTDKYYDEAFHLDVKNMLLLDADRLLAGFRDTAGVIAGMSSEEITKFMKGKSRYGGMWEDGLIGGHTMGHYITALAQAVGNPALSEDEAVKVRERLDYILTSIRECQKLTVGTPYEGYIFAAAMPTEEFRKNPVLQFDNVEKGLSHLFNEAWVPWYTMHKILTGLNAAFAIAGSEVALEIANDLGKWIANRTEGWSEETQKTVLGIEYGGINDCLYELYEINRDLEKSGSDLYYKEYERFKNAAHSFDDVALFEKILTGKKDLLNNVHANTTIPKFIGAFARYDAVEGEDKYLEYAEAFWDMVVDKHTYVTGGNSEDEHFGEDNILDKERTNVNNETCNTYNMLKFSRRLFGATGKKKYIDYSERTLINAIMASQNHESGFTTYFQPMATGYHKVFNNLDDNFWCCTGTGYENFTKLQRGIYYKAQNKLAVTLYIASELKTDDYELTLDCDLTKSDMVKISVKPVEGKTVSDDFYLMIPSWLKNEAEFSIGESRISLEKQDGFYVIPAEMIREGGEITAKLPMGITVSNLKDGPNTYAFIYGPYVLSARLGNAKMSETSHGVRVSVSAEKSVENDIVKVTSEKTVDDFIANIDKYLIKRDGEMEFDLTGTDRKLVFTTHYNQYTESYGIYWTFE